MPKRGIMHLKATATDRAKYEAAVAADWRFLHLFRFLRASPTYLAAHNRHRGQLPAGPTPRGKDGEAVGKAYADFQSVWDRTFSDWWDDRGRYLFGVAVEPEIEVFAHLPLSLDPKGEDLRRILGRVEDYLLDERPSLASPPMVLMAVPLVPNRGAMLRALNDRLTEAFDAVSRSGTVSRCSMEASRVRQATAEAAWVTLCHWAAFPNDPLWRVSHRVSLYKLKKHAKGKVDDRDPPVDKREDMASSTSRVHKRAYLLSENAARGSFPSMARLGSKPIAFDSWRQELAVSLADEITALHRRAELPT